MGRTKLVIVEGIPGTGKTSSAQWIHAWLDQNGLAARLHLEGDLDHPADYESTACLAPAEFRRLLDEYPLWREALSGLAQQRGHDTFVSYRKIGLPMGLFQALARREVYELPEADFRRVTLQKWADFATMAEAGQSCYVFECCLLQNQTTTLMAFHDRDDETIAAQVLAIAEVLRPLNPLIVYLEPPSVRAGLERIASQRPQEWLDFVIRYTTTQAWGQKRGTSGFEGLVRFYETRRDLEKKLFPRLGWRGLWEENAGQDWPRTLGRLRQFMAENATV
jgi:hypothetical protein